MMTVSVEWISADDALPVALRRAVDDLALDVLPARPEDVLGRREARGGVSVVDARLDTVTLDRLAAVDQYYLVATSEPSPEALTVAVEALNRLGAHGILTDHPSSDDVLARAVHRVREQGRTQTARRELDATVARLRAQLADVEASNVSARASIDAATGLWDTLHLVERIEDELNRLIRYGTPFGVLAVTIGSQSLAHDVAFSQVLLDFVRRVDVATRRGLGDFAVVCPSTESAGMRRFAERLADAVRAAVEQGDLQPTTPHIAVVAYDSGKPRSDTVLSDLAAALQAVGG